MCVLKYACVLSMKLRCVQRVENMSHIGLWVSHRATTRPGATRNASSSGDGANYYNARKTNALSGRAIEREQYFSPTSSPLFVPTRSASTRCHLIQSGARWRGSLTPYTRLRVEVKIFGCGGDHYFIIKALFSQVVLETVGVFIGPCRTTHLVSMLRRSARGGRGIWV